MATTVNLRKLLDRKVWEPCAPHPTPTHDMVGCESTQPDNLQLWVAANYAYFYDAMEDAWEHINDVPASLVSLNYTSVAYHPYGPSGTASAGTSTTITTTANMVINAVGYTIRITGGTGIGQERTIASNTNGANSIITVSSAWSVTPDATSTYQLLTGKWYVFNASTPVFRSYDYATNTWSATLSVTGVTGFFNMPSMILSASIDTMMATGTATSATGTTLVNSGKAWTTNQYANSQVRITAGTGIGQVRTITSNTATTLTVPTWTVTPDATSVYQIEQNYDYIYLMGNGIITYRYTISTNTWTTLSPTVARGTAMGVGSYANIVTRTDDTTWANENNIKNGRFIYSFAGGGSTGSGNLSVYDIGLNTWVNYALSYGRAMTASSTTNGGFAPAGGASWTSTGNHLYFLPAVSSSSHIQGYKFNVVTNALEGWTTFVIYAPSGGGTSGEKLTIARYTDGTTTLKWIYQYLYGTSPSTLYRQLVI